MKKQVKRKVRIMKKLILAVASLCLLTLCVGAATITLSSTADGITADGGSLTVTANVSGADDDTVVWTIDNVNALPAINGNSLTLTAKINGSVTVTAMLKSDPSVRTEKIFAISGQANRTPEKIVKYVSYGNSYHWHAKAEGIGWNGDWGMAASSPADDYVHKLTAHLQSRYGENNVVHLYNIYGADTGSANFETSIVNLPDDYDYTEMLSGVKAFLIEEQPDVVTIQYGENSGSVTVAQFRNALTQFVRTVLEANPDAVVLITNPHWGDTKKQAVAEAAAALDIPYVDFSFINNKAEYFAYSSAFVANASSGVKSHPGDKGHTWIADSMYEAMSPYLTEKIDTHLTYTDLPTAIQITSDGTSITQEGGTLVLHASVVPEGVSQDVVYTSDNENVAVVDANGVVTAVNNGSVTVTVRSAYDADVYSSVLLTVTGQPPCYTVIYDKNTADDVTQLPEAFAYARGTYALSDKRPRRTAYAFVGWALSPDGEPTAAINVTHDTTVYALWEKASRWTFDRLGDKEDFTVKHGFNEYVLDGCFMMIATGTDVPRGSVLEIASPVLSLNASDFTSLRIRMRNTETADGTILKLVLSTDHAKYTFKEPVVTTDFTTYTFDLSDIFGTITGFSFKPTDIDCTIFLDEIAFEADAAVIGSVGYPQKDDEPLAVTFHVKTPDADGVTAVAALFDEADRLLEAKLLAVDAGEYRMVFADEAHNADEVRIFLLDEVLKPVGKSKRTKIVRLHTVDDDINIPADPLFGD